MQTAQSVVRNLSSLSIEAAIKEDNKNKEKLMEKKRLPNRSKERENK